MSELKRCPFCGGEAKIDKRRRWSMTAQEIKIACMICCPMCDEKKCVGRFECQEIKKYLEKMNERI